MLYCAAKTDREVVDDSPGSENSRHEIGKKLAASFIYRFTLFVGQAWRYEMFPLVTPELDNWNLLRVLNRGSVESIESRYDTGSLS